MFEKLLCCWVALEQRWINSPEHEEGMATAEYAIGVLAAAAFAGVLLAIMRSGTLRGMLLNILRSALQV